MKRILDFIASFVGLVFLSPILLTIIIIIYIYDFHSPFYRPIRVGKDGKDFRMLKLRTMVVNADKIGPISTSSSDPRITPIGHFIRKFKLDEFVQLWNVLIGTMSLVGPRPQIKEHVEDCYTKEEMGLLSVKPGMTDFSSIVFYDSNEILSKSDNPYLYYNQLIRPWKSRLGLIYIKNQSFILDIKLILLTLLAIFSKKKALSSVYSILKKLDIMPNLLEISKREKPLYPFPPPGAKEIITHI